MTLSLLASVETRMRDSIGASQQVGNIASQAGLYHLAAGGGRVRASLCLDASLQLGLNPSDATTLATICELLHNASLIQDDLLDRACLRRGVPSVWMAFSDGAAVCAGDLLLANAFALVGELSCANDVVPVLALVHRRTQEVILGQGKEQASILDTLESYEAVAIGKSASLLSLPLELPLLVSGNEEALGMAQRTAQAFATAYQMIDDLEDYNEDIRNGSLNAVSIARAQGSPDYESACAFICSRAEALLEDSVACAAKLPRDCGAGMIACAEKMCSALHARLNSMMHPMDASHHGR